jgi:hypothetical protein
VSRARSPGSTAPELVGDLIGARRIERHEGDADQVHNGVEIDRLDIFVENLRFSVVRHRCRHIEAGEHREAERPPA